MSVWDKVQELEPRERAFQVFHRRLQISRKDYLEESSFPHPLSEQGYQDFVARYLQAKGDKGVVGMVRVEEWQEDIVLDAAVRYPVDVGQQNSCLSSLEYNS